MAMGEAAEKALEVIRERLRVDAFVETYLD
jgi:hypothetical protein